MDNPDFSGIVILIPSFKPPHTFHKFISDLQKMGLNQILVVNDGSPPIYNNLFNQIKGIHILNNLENKGKGFALKTGLAYIKLNHPELKFVITCDDDGQHDPSDIFKIAFLCSRNNYSNVTFGSREFGKGTPLKSRIGNIFMSKMIWILSGYHISDSQTGLRCFPVSLISKIKNIQGDGFSFETNCLLYLIENKILISEVKVNSIYFNNNSHTRFKVFIDSIIVIKEMFYYWFKR